MHSIFYCAQQQLLTHILSDEVNPPAHRRHGPGSRKDPSNTSSLVLRDAFIKDNVLREHFLIDECAKLSQLKMYCFKIIIFL